MNNFYRSHHLGFRQFRPLKGIPAIDDRAIVIKGVKFTNLNFLAQIYCPCWMVLLPIIVGIPWRGWYWWKRVGCCKFWEIAWWGIVVDSVLLSTCSTIFSNWISPYCRSQGWKRQKTRRKSRQEGIQKSKSRFLVSRLFAFIPDTFFFYFVHFSRQNVLPITVVQIAFLRRNTEKFTNFHYFNISFIMFPIYWLCRRFANFLQ